MQFSYPHIVRMLGVAGGAGPSDSWKLLVEYCEGGDLESLLKRGELSANMGYEVSDYDSKGG